MKKVSLIIPCYNEEESLPLLYLELKKLMDGNPAYEWEVLCVNDGSRDNTLEVLRRMHEADSRVGYIDLSRNFGKENAMLAGFDYVTGDCAVVLDADLQHPPGLIPEMLKEWESGYDDVYAKRESRGKESRLRKSLTMAFYSLLQKTSGIEMLKNVGDFRLLDRKCVSALCSMRESVRYSKGLFCWIGFRKKEVTYRQNDRIAGNSNWSLWSLFNFAIDGIVSFSTSPLRISTVLGFMTAIFSFLMMVYYVVKTLLFGDPIQGFPTLITIILLLGGIQLIAIGILGEYIGSIFNEVKRRPNYLVQERCSAESSGSAAAYESGEKQQPDSGDGKGGGARG